MSKTRTVVLGVTASVAIYKSCDIIRRLQDERCSVIVVMTKEAEEFINPALFRTLSGNRVYRGMFEEPEAWEIDHVSLAGRADLVLIAPATANIIGKIACGISDDLLTCVVCATSAPVVICPAMNEGMLANRVTQQNIQKLASMGLRFVGPKKGRLACGKAGLGCLADVETIVQETIKLL